MRFGWLAVLAIGAAACPLYLASASKLVDHDVFVMGEVAQMVLDGATLYETAWDNKPPLALLSYALPLGVAPGSYRAVQLGLAVLVTVQGLLIWRLLRGEPPWFRLGAATMAIVLPLHSASFVWWSSEDVANLLAIPVILGSYRILTRGELGPGRCLAIGAALTLGFHARQTIVLFGPLPIVALLGCGRPAATRLVALLWLAAGAALGLAVIAALIAWLGDWWGYVETVFLAPRRYRGHYWNMIQGIFEARDRAPAFLLLAATVVLVARGPRRAFFLTLAATSALVVLAPMKPFYHYYEQLTPALCLMVPAAIARIAPPREAPVALGAVLGFFAVNAALTCGHMGLINTDLQGTRPRAAMDRVAAAVERAAVGDDTLFAAGRDSAYVYFATDVPAASPYFWDLFFLAGVLELAPVESESVYRAYETNPPDLLALDRAMLDLARERAGTAGGGRFAALLATWLGSGGYDVVDELEGYTILRRGGRSAGSPGQAGPAGGIGARPPRMSRVRVAAGGGPA